MRHITVVQVFVLGCVLMGCNGSSKSSGMAAEAQPAADANTPAAAAPGASQANPNMLTWTLNGKRIQALDAVFAEITPATPKSFATDSYLSVALSADPNLCDKLADPNNFPNMLLISIKHPQALPGAQSANFIVSQDANTPSTDQSTASASAELISLTTTAGVAGIPRYTTIAPGNYANGSAEGTYQSGSVTMTVTAADANSLTLVVNATASTIDILQDNNDVTVRTDQLQGSIVAKRCPNLNVGLDVANDSSNPFSPKFAGRPQTSAN